jgi:hypothetical protein
MTSCAQFRGCGPKLVHHGPGRFLCRGWPKEVRGLVFRGNAALVVVHLDSFLHRDEECGPSQPCTGPLRLEEMCTVHLDEAAP